MKKVLLSLLVSTGIAFAGTHATDRAQTMQNLEASMAFMQKGFLYNNETMIKQGVKDFKKILRNVDSFVIEVDPKEKVGKFDPRRYARTETRAIGTLADELLENFKTGTKNESVAAYDKILNRCLSCHRIIRKW